MDARIGWSAAGGVVAVLAAMGAVAFWSEFAFHSDWQMALAAFCLLVMVVGVYWMLAALNGWWPFSRFASSPSAKPPQPPTRTGILNRPGARARIRNTEIRNQDKAIENQGELDAEGTDIG